MSMASARKVTQDASAASAGTQSLQDVIMVSADPIMVINSGDSEFMASALLRTEVALASLTVTSHQDQELSIVNLALKSVLSNYRMDHLSDVR